MSSSAPASASSAYADKPGTAAVTKDVKALFTGDGHADLYAKFRPTYPPALYDAILEYMGPEAPRGVAVDIATGSGQAALDLARYFRTVLALDASEAQVKKAPVVPNVEFRVGEAEATGLPDESADCVSVAQALHWFNLPVFYCEAHRVLRPGGVLAAWGYATCALGVPALDDAVRVLYDGDLGAYWSPKRRLVDAEYAGLEPTNFRDVTRVTLPLVKPMTVRDFLGYLTTWSSYQDWRKATAGTGVPDVITDKLYSAFRAADASLDPDTMLTVTWPVFTILARK